MRWWDIVGCLCPVPTSVVWTSNKSIIGYNVVLLGGGSGGWNVSDALIADANFACRFGRVPTFPESAAL